MLSSSASAMRYASMVSGREVRMPRTDLMLSPSAGPKAYQSIGDQQHVV